MRIRTYEFASIEDLDCFNIQMKTIGLSIQQNLFGDYVAFLDEHRFKSETKKSRRKTCDISKNDPTTYQNNSDGSESG